MAVTLYLAMTAAEFTNQSAIPANPAWMACHFSPYGAGLTGLPQALPAGSLLILNDRIPYRRHDPQQIAAELARTAEQFSCRGVLLDFQGEKEALRNLSAYLEDALPCPVAVSDRCAEGLSCPVFLPPCPHHISLTAHMAAWKGRALWLDLAADAETITLTPSGAEIRPFPVADLPEHGHHDEGLHCHYSIETGDSFARFTLWRTKEDLEALAREAEQSGITTLVGLWQELAGSLESGE